MTLITFKNSNLPLLRIYEIKTQHLLLLNRLTLSHTQDHLLVSEVGFIFSVLFLLFNSLQTC